MWRIKVEGVRNVQKYMVGDACAQTDWVIPLDVGDCTHMDAILHREGE